MSLPSPLIFVPKKVTQDVDFAPALKSVIAKTYSESPDAYNEELGALNRARQDALRGSAGSDTTARDLLYKYFGQLELLELRFPELRVPFPWSDAFTNVKISQQSLAYEKASVIFNIGATLSSLAASSPRTGPEGLKRAFHSFRCAAGMFVYINENFLHAPSTDLSKEVVKLLVGLMVAQASEVFVETMGPATGKSAGLRSKLCMQVSSAYAALVEDVKEWHTKGVFLREWSLLIQTKAKYFGSLAHYHRSTADTNAGKYGEALAHLQVAENLAKEANRLAQLFTSTFSTTSAASSLQADAPVAIAELVKAHLALVTETHAKAQKDNDIVYNEVVPSEASLPPIDKGKPIAEPIPIHDVYAAPDVQKLVGPDLFQKLVPLSVHESASMYSEEKAKLVRAEAERVELADEELASALEYMGLPASLARFQAGAAAQASLADPGPQVRGWADEVRHGEANGRVEDLFRRLGSLKEQAGRHLDAIAQDLDSETRECESLRTKYGHLWAQQPSSSGTRSFRQDLRSHRESLEQAAGSDAQAQALWESIRGDAGVLADPSGQALERIFVEAIGSGGATQANLLDSDLGDDDETETKKRVEVVSDALSRLNKIKKERAETLRDLKEKVQTDDISHILILNRKGSADAQPALFATELEKFRPHQQRLTQTLQAQQSALADVNNGFKTLTESSKARQVQGQWADAERKKRDLITRLGRAAQAYGDVRTALEKGLHFYQDLNDLVDGLQQQVNGWISMRTSERERMAAEAEIKQRLEDGASGPSAASGPSGLDRAMGSLNLGLGGARSPPPSVPSPSAYSQPISYPSSASSPPPSNPYGSFPSTGAFSLSSPPPEQPSAHSQYARPPAPQQSSYSSSSAYSPAPSYPTAPPIPPVQPSYPSYGSGQPSYPSPAPSNVSSYGQPARQASFPAPPQPVTQSSYLPPPPQPVSYQSSGYGQPGQYGQPAGGPPPPPSRPPQPSYSQQQQYPQYGSGPPQPPPRPY
ncbi:bck1-like resistance to osmotic shock [Rhodotorula mucilaginosa]|uniref:BRO domain-containing protein 1 n=1 Tax=Rhodotorula mucilaginosa TaxID=5537 RepID=A0A9P7B2A7_RHOMI|nr:bck1-like resistance to osmotic shock [Rhodotorula mucilaginosa]